MLKPELIDELKIIAYSDMAASNVRVQACATLYKIGSDPSKLMDVLESIASAAETSDRIKVSAIELLHKIDDAVGNTPVQQAIDEQNVKEALLEQYCGSDGDTGKI